MTNGYFNEPPLVRSDLLEAHANIDWASSQFIPLNERIDAWLKANVTIEVEETGGSATHDAVVAVEHELFPLTFNAEVGAYINVIRSSLDILATALAQRHASAIKPEEIYFPVARSEEDFRANRYSGSKFIRELPEKERGLITALEPYKGGNEALWSLHRLDVMRKHRRLIDIEIRPLSISLSGSGVASANFTPLAVGSLRVNEKTIIGLIAKNAPRLDIQWRPYAAMYEAEDVHHRKPILATLIRLAQAASTAIRVFDY